MIRPIVTTETEKGTALLRRKSHRVVRMNTQQRKVVRDLIDTVRAAGGLGLAAVQIGVQERIFVLRERMPEGPGRRADAPAQYRTTVFVNPVIVSKNPSTGLDVEGCLSIPGYEAVIERSTGVIIRHNDGSEWLTGLMARAAQHEMDHLDGILIMDRALPVTVAEWAREGATRT